MASKICNCPACFNKVDGDEDGIDLCGACFTYDCDPFGGVDGVCNVQEAAKADAIEAITHDCAQCEGPPRVLGPLGNRVHFRCRNCGNDWSEELR
jgi:hypothetical protein